MIPRKLAMPTLLAATVAIPYGASNAPQWMQPWRAQQAVPTASTNKSADAQPGAPAPPPLKTNPALTAPPQGPNATLYPTRNPLEGVTTYSLADVLRMDVPKEWVYQRWPRKSTALSDLDLYGVRVPLVTGSKLYDLAGSLTYFFGRDGRVQRISFRGRTGDTTQVVTLAAQRFGLQPQPTVVVGEQLLQVRRGEDVISQLKTRPAPVLWASSPHDSFAVELDIQDPTSGRPLKTSVAELPPAPQRPTPSATAETPKLAVQAKEPSPESEQPSVSGWKTFFPRSRLPEPQLENLRRGDLYP
jgi:hypothetical protein